MTRSSSPGGSPSGYEPAYGGIPNLPPYATDTTKMVGTDIQANLLKNLPNYMGMVGADVGNITSNLAGQLPSDVIGLMQQQAAERGIATGTPGSPNTNAAYLRALGLTSLQLQQLGHSQLTEAMQRTPVQQTQETAVTRDLGPERAIYAAAPVPGAAARQALINAQMGMQEGRRYAGGIGGYGGGVGGYGAARAGAAPVTATPSPDYGFVPGGGRTGYFPEEVDPYTALRAFPVSYGGGGAGTGTYYSGENPTSWLDPYGTSMVEPTYDTGAVDLYQQFY